MNWIKVATQIKSDPRMVAIAAACRCKVSDAVGLVVCVLTEMPEHARDGNLSGLHPNVIEAWALWSGKRGVFATAFFTHLCDEHGVVRAWEKYNGQALRRMAEDVARKRRASDVRKLSAGIPQEFRTLSTVDETRRDETRETTNQTEDRRVVQDLCVDAPHEPPTGQRSVVDGPLGPDVRGLDHVAMDAKFGGERAPSSPPPIPRSVYATQERELHAAGLPHERIALDALIASHAQPHAVVLELHSFASGMKVCRGPTTGRTADIADVMRAVAEMAANGIGGNERPWNVSLFRGYLRRIADRAPEPASAEEREAKKLAAQIAQQNAHQAQHDTPRTADEIEAARVAREAAMQRFRAEFRRYNGASAELAA